MLLRVRMLQPQQIQVLKRNQRLNFKLINVAKYILKVIGILIGIEIILFLGMIVTSMTDEKPPFISRAFYWALKYVFGFPLVLINENYPFFLDSKEIPSIAIVLIIINNLILAFIVFGIFKRLLHNS